MQIKFCLRYIGITILFALVILILPTSANAAEWIPSNNMNVARVWHSATVLNDGRVLVAGGYGTATSEIYDPSTGQWSNAATMTQVYWNHVATLLQDGRVLVAGGVGPTWVAKTSAEIYDPVANTWTATTSMNVPREAHEAVLLPNGKVLVAGGYNPSLYNLDTAEVYDPTTGTWTLVDNLHTNICCSSLSLLTNSKVLIAGGENGGTGEPHNSDSETELFDSISNTWSTSSSLITSRARHRATTLQDGRVVVVGGWNVFPASIPSSEIYNPATDIWTPTGSTIIPRAYHQQSLMGNGNILLTGGVTNYNNPQISAEVYDISTESWSLTEDMSVPRSGHTSTTLPDGQVLITGGNTSNASIQPSANTEVYTLGSYLQVPYLSQNDEAWGSEEYDSASKWSNNPTISSWGCALTSAVMILKFHGYNLLPDGTEINPSTLNDWFMAQNDNYIRNGLVNWSAINRLSTEAKQINNITDFEALDYIRIENNNRDILTDYIEQEIPVVLEIPTGPNSSHFVVANGIEGESITINDPLGTYTTLDGYNNEFRSMRVLKPTNTDLSAIQIVVNQNVNIDVQKSSGIITGSQFLHLPIENDDGTGSSGEPLNIYYLHDPESGNYNVKLSSDIKQKFQVDVYLYDKNANVKMKSFNGVLSGRSNDEITIEFSKLNAEKSKINRKRAVGFDF